MCGPTASPASGAPATPAYDSAMDVDLTPEQEAFRKIQKMSMNTRKPMKEIAQAIVLAQDAKSQ